MGQEQPVRVQEEEYAQVVTKSSQDEGFKRRLVADPRAVLREYGIAVPDGQAVRVVENTAETIYMALPTKPSGGLSDGQLARLAGEGQGATRKVGQLLLKVWQDPTFKRRLVADPRAVLQEEGLPVPAGKAVRVVEDTAETMHLVLPHKPAEGELTDDQLEQVAGGIVPLIAAGALIGVGVTCLVKGGSEAFGWFE